MNPPTVDMKDILVAQGVGAFGGSADWAIFIGKEPHTPDNCITLYDTAGDIPNPKWLLDFPRFQIRVRSNSYIEGYEKAEECKKFLLGLPSQTIVDIRYIGVYIVSDTQLLMSDDKGRSIFVSTWRVTREPSQVSGSNRRPL